jgi:hypothetical protein
MTDTFRALCAELVEAWDATADFDFNDFGHAAADIVTRARAALAAEPVPPADGEVAELVAWLRKDGVLLNLRPAIQCRIVRAADLLERLSQPEPVAPTESDVTELFYRHMGEGSEVGFENAIAEALARWGTPAIAAELEAQ